MQRELLLKLLKKNEAGVKADLMDFNYFMEHANGYPYQMAIIDGDDYTTIPSTLYPVCGIEHNKSTQRVHTCLPPPRHVIISKTGEI